MLAFTAAIAARRPREVGRHPRYSRTYTLDTFRTILLAVPILLFSAMAHEYAHAYAAMKQGDNTARDLGLLTFNPLKQIDPFMTIILPVSLAIMGWPVFGGVKGVPVNPQNYKHYVRGDIIVSLAGITANFIIAAVCVPLIILVGMWGTNAGSLATPLAIFQLMLEKGVQINLLLAVFNLLPIPPLDGSHVFKHLLPLRWALMYQRIGSAGLLILLLLLSFGGSIMSVWFAPIFLVYKRLEAVFAPYMLPNPFSQ